MTDQSISERDALSTHDLFWNAFASRDIDLRFSVCADDITFIGSGLNEEAANKAAYRKINDEVKVQTPDPFQIHCLWKRVKVVDNIAWIESEMEWQQSVNDVELKESLRTTTILKFESLRWMVVHVHGSAPDYRFIEGAYMFSKETARRNKELEREVFQRTQELNKSLEDLRATQAQLIQSEKMASLGELTAGIAHEIQNPLNFVNNFSEVNKELLEEMSDEINNGNLDAAKQIAKDVSLNEEKIRHHGKRADTIVKGMLQHSRSSSGQKEPTDINELADEYLRLAYHGLRAKDKSFNATIKTDFDDHVGKINVIPQDIGRVILNLITNAFYAVREKKKTSSNPAASASYEPTVIVSTKRIDDKIEIKVADNGDGISKEISQKIFQPFFTTKPTGEGTGLGLSMSYEIITKGHAGELSVQSPEPGGAEFIINLPVKS